ncbi:terminase [Terriglobus roseus]|uniref:Terminase-like family protein n=1 Tax=Terriglobus roseus TaxID=392734 RepID=A0A1H4MXL1_9BACT|nr:terminase [Terriglobus roseus]SEB87703.1 hypothetical protein SAMN05443244_2071 [Terriglobus roseus]
MGKNEDWTQLRAMLDTPIGAVLAPERCIVVRDKGGGLVPLHANRAQQSFAERRGTENIVLKARQMGISTWVAARFLLRTLLVPGTTTLMVAHTRESAESLFAVVARMWENLPTDLRDSVGSPGRARLGQFTFPEIDSEFRIASAAEPNAGRGLTVHNLHCSEVARWGGDPAETLAGLRAALAPGGELVLESTPNGAYGCFYEQWQQAEASGMVRHFFPWWWEPAYVGMPVVKTTAEEAALAARHRLSAEQLGFRRELARRFGAMRSQEFAEDAVSCFRESGACFFDREVLAMRTKEVTRPLEVRRDKSLQVWLPAVPGRSYLAGVDSAGGGSEGDFSAVQLIDVATGVQCAELQARLSPRDLARAAAELAREYNGAMLVVERNNHGTAVLAYLEQETGANIYTGRDGLPGRMTDVASRPRMLSDMAVLLSQRPELFRSERLLGECRSFVTDEHGRAAAARGSHDDLVMSMAIAHAVRGLIAT